MPSIRLVVLFGLCAALGALLWFDRTNGSSHDLVAAPRAAASGDVRDRNPRAASVRDAVIGEQNPLASLSLAQLGAIVERPLFTSTRRPLLPMQTPTRSADVASAARPERTFTLVGILKDDVGRRIALLREDGGVRNFRVEAGDAVDGWRILAIEPDALVMARGERQTVLKLPSSR